MRMVTSFIQTSGFFILILLVSHHPAQAQSALRSDTASPAPAYWQQEVRYDIKVTLDETGHSLKGFEDLVYTNHSPDTLHYIYMHIWPNAYKDNTTALYRQLSTIEERKEKLKRIKENGYIDQLAFTAGGAPITTEPHPQYADILKLLLPQALLPGASVTFTTPFFVKIPSYFSRLGHEGKSYMITQWYPKPAVYDSKGWHEMPYLDQGEFYSEYGSYDVHITLPATYVVGATGQLLTTTEAEAYKNTGHPPHKTSPTKTLDYHADNVHDFAWFADQNFIVRHDTLQLPSGKIIDVFSYYRPNGNKEWNNSLSYIKDAVLHYSKWVGEYAYPVVSAVEGPGNTSSGGMEYPMITLITSPHADKAELDGVIAHEVGHNWFYGMLGSNEREHPWMDEGINTYYEFRYEAEKYRSNGILGNSMIPSNVKKLGTEDFLDAIYNVIDQLKAAKPIETPAPDFTSEFDYGLVVYARTALWMHVLEKDLGKETLEKGMKNYFSEWKFKHPYPENLQASLEEVTHTSLDKLFALLNTTDPL